MAYNSAHTGPQIDAAVEMLGQIQSARDATAADRDEVAFLASQVGDNASQVASQAATVGTQSAQVLAGAAEVEQAHDETISASLVAVNAKDAAALSASSAQTSQASATASASAAAQSQVEAGLSEQISSENAESSSADRLVVEALAQQVEADRESSQVSADSAALSALNAAAVVTGGTATIAPAPGKIPLADAEGKINSEWLGADMARTDAVQVATELANDSLEAIADIQDSADPAKGAAKVGWDGESVGDQMNLSKKLANYTELGNYTGAATRIELTQSGISGTIFRDPTVTVGDGGTTFLDGLGRGWRRDYYGSLMASWFGAKLNGGIDDTSAFQAAINSVSYGEIAFSGTPLITATLTLSRKAIKFKGLGYGTEILFRPAVVPSVLFDFYVDAATKQHSIASGFVVRTDVAGVGTTFKISTYLTAAATQVNGQFDTLTLENIECTFSGGGYWLHGLHTQNTGGVHYRGLKIENPVAAQAIPGVEAIYIENDDSRVNVIRAINGLDLYAVRAHRALRVKAVKGVESIYMKMGEIVGVQSAGVFLEGGGNVGAVNLDGLHFDVVGRAMDCRGAQLTFSSFKCDFRKSSNGGVTTAGPLISLDAGEMVNFSGSSFSGIDSLLNDETNLAFEFNNALNGVSMRRFGVTGSLFRNFVYAFGDTHDTSQFKEAGNAYAVIRKSVFSDAQQLEAKASKSGSLFTNTFTVSMDATGTQTISQTVTGIYTKFPPAVATLVQMSPSGSDLLNIQYDWAGSTNTVLKFIVKGNTAARTVRFGLISMDTIKDTTAA